MLIHKNQNLSSPASDAKRSAERGSRRNKRGFAAHHMFCFAALSVLAACTGPAMPPPDVTFQHIQPMPISVANVETHVEPGTEVDGFVISPTTASERYLSTRFRAAGTQGLLRANMEEITVRHVYSPSKGNVSGYLGVAGHDVYDVKAVLRLEHVSDRGTVLYGNTIKAQRTMNITEHASVAEREQHQIESLEKLFADLDQQVLRIVLADMHLGMQ
ncbi:MAG: hypothetical protein WBK77_05760 [Alphaproteobacteria bacterium]